MLVDTGATEHLLADGLIPGLKNRRKDYTPLDAPNGIVAEGKGELQVTATGILYGTIVD